MFKKNLYIILLLISTASVCQVQNLVDKFDLPSEVTETSGLLFLNGKILTHNDSGDGPKLYEIDTISGAITRTITIANATHIDWEDIAQDDTYIYIGDIGNNNGTRTDLKIYRILKSDVVSENSINSESITFYYEDQSDFTSKVNNNNFDAEAISIYKDKIVIFTKNWVDNTVNAYTIPKIIGNHTAKKMSTYNSEGLITGSAYNEMDDSFLLSGYTNVGKPFLVFIKNNNPINENFFSGTIEKTDINPIIGTSQIEGITLINGKKYFLSREKVTAIFNGFPIVLNQKLYRFDNGSFVLNTTDFYKEKQVLFPNPSGDMIHIKNINSQSIENIKILDIGGRLYVSQTLINNNQISISRLKSGLYFVRIRLKDQRLIIKKFIKN